MSIEPPEALPGVVGIRADRRAIDRVWRWVVGLVGFLFAVVVAISAAVIVLVATSDFAGGGQLLFVFLLFGFMTAVVGLQLASTVRTWRRLRSVEVAMELGVPGVLLRSYLGSVRAPWEALEVVAFERSVFGGRVRFRLVPPTDPRATGTLWDFPAGRTQRLVRKLGLAYALRVLDVEPGRLDALLREYSRGRVRITHG